MSFAKMILQKAAKSHALNGVCVNLASPTPNHSSSKEMILFLFYSFLNPSSLFFGNMFWELSNLFVLGYMYSGYQYLN